MAGSSSCDRGCRAAHASGCPIDPALSIIGVLNRDREAEIVRRFGFGRRHALTRTGFTLYARAVTAARDPSFYTELAVADTLDGHFDMICLHVALLTRRLAREPALAQAVFDAMFTDMDGCLREGGVGDLGVPRRVTAMWEGYNGRATAYGRALDGGDEAALSMALLRNIWRGRDDASRQADMLAGWTIRQEASLAAQPDAALVAGTVRFTAVPDAGAVDGGAADGGASIGMADAGEAR